MSSTNSKHGKNQSTEQTRKQLSTSQAQGRDQLSTFTATASTSPDTDGKFVATT